MPEKKNHCVFYCAKALLFMPTVDSDLILSQPERFDRQNTRSSLTALVDRPPSICIILIGISY